MRQTSANIFQIYANPFGVTYREWSKKWWQWLLIIPKSCSPAYDPTGKNASVGQNDPNVFFLCQTLEGTEEKPKRRISIPRGTSVFMPIINWISNTHEHGKSARELISVAKKRMDVIGNLEFSFNGIVIKGMEKYRFLTDPFDIVLPKNNILDLPSGKVRVISDGYWVCTMPIYKDLSISTYGSCSSGVTTIGVNYEIKVI